MKAMPLKEMIYHFLPKAKKTHRDKFRQDRTRLLKICDILHKHKQLPSAWQEVKQYHVDLIIQVFRRQHYADSTIMAYIKSLRTILDKSFSSFKLPMPKQLGLIKPPNSACNKNPMHEILDRISYAPIKKIIGLEILFGLKKREAMQLRPSFSCQDNALYVPIGISSNNTDRHVPIDTQKQIQFVAEIKNSDDSDVSEPQRINYRYLSAAYANELRRHNFQSNIQYRQLYAKWRFQHLLKNAYPEAVAQEQLCYNLGVSIRHVRRMLHE